MGLYTGLYAMGYGFMLWGTGLCYGVRVYDMGYGFMIWGMDLNGMGYGLIY